MVNNGLKNNSVLTKEFLTNAHNFYQAAELRSDDRKKYAHMLTAFAERIKNAIKDKDIVALFALEKDAQEYDFASALGEDKRRDSLSALRDLHDYWQRCQDKNSVVTKLEDAFSGIGMPTKPINDPTMSNGIKSQCRKLAAIAGSKKTVAEELFYKTRQDALRFIEKEHCVMINQHLGFDISQQKRRGR